MFEGVGQPPRALEHPSEGFVDALVLFRIPRAQMSCEQSALAATAILNSEM
jgi:hypothetical protein